MKNITRFFFFFILLFIAVTGCRNNQKQDNKNQVKIGLIADLTGPMATYGNWVKNGVEIAYEDLANEKNVDLLIEDSKSEPKSAVNAINKLISTSGVQFIITGNGSGAIMSMSPIAEKNKVILFVTLASSPSISGAGEYVFRNRVSGLYEAGSLVDFAKEQGFDHFGAIALNNEAGKPYINAFETQLKKFHAGLILSELVSVQQTDLRTQALKFKEKNVSSVFLVLQVDQAVNFIKQCIEINYYPNWLGISSLKSDKILQLPEKIKSSFYLASENIDSSNQDYQKFNTEYKNRHGENAGIYSVNGYDGFNILYQLIKENAGDVEGVKEKFHQLVFEGAGGKMTFDENGDAKREIQIFRIENNSFTSVN